MQIKKPYIAALAGLCLLGVSAVSVFVWPVVPRIEAAAPPPEERARLIAEKKRAMAAEGIPSYDGPPPTMRAGAPVRRRAETARVTKAELLANWDAAWPQHERFFDELARGGLNPAAVEARRKEALDGRKKLEGLPEGLDGKVELELSLVEIGSHSIDFEPFTKDMAGNQKDPINLIFIGKGSAADVRYDLKNWVSPGERWNDAGCGEPQQVWIRDSIHSGGWDGFRQTSYMMDRQNHPYICVFPRLHLRLFGAFVVDSHGEAGQWSVGAAHWDPLWHPCGDDWEGGEWTVKTAFWDNANNNWHWFVTAVWDGYPQNAGHFGPPCNSYNDGAAPIIWLNS